MQKSLIALALVAAMSMAQAASTYVEGSSTTVERSREGSGVACIKFAPEKAPKQVAKVDLMTGGIQHAHNVRTSMSAKPQAMQKPKKPGQFTPGGQYVPGAHDVSELKVRLMI